jgi:hypothetical protein
LNSDNKNHLNEDQLIQAIVDDADLPAPVLTHLAECGQCLESKQSFEQDLLSLGQMAQRLAPKPQRRIVIPVRETKRSFLSSFNRRIIIAAAATVAAVLIVIWGANLVINLPGRGTENLTAELLEAERLMTEVNTLVDNALPPFYLEISGEKTPDYNEEFYQFLIPSIEQETLT